MNKSVLGKIVSAAVISLGAIAVSLPAQAGTLTAQGDWNYARDDYSYDGSDADGFSSHSRFDIYGIGVKQVGNQLWVGLNASTPLTGVNYYGNNIGWGDLFLDFGVGSTFKSAQGSLVGIRFAPNDGNVNSSNNGVYTDVKGKAIAQNNSGYSSLNHYSGHATTAVIGDLAVNSPYYADYANAGVPNVIDGNPTKVGNVTALSSGELFGLPGTDGNKFGFKFSLPSTYSGSFVGSLFLECINDSVAIQGNYKAVPVPPAIAGIIAAGAFGGWRAARRKKQLKAVEA